MFSQGPLKNEIEYFIYKLYQKRNSPLLSLSRTEIIEDAEAFGFPPEITRSFRDLPETSLDEPQLIDALNEILERRGQIATIGGKLQKVDSVPTDWERAYHEHYAIHR